MRNRSETYNYRLRDILISNYGSITRAAADNGMSISAMQKLLSGTNQGYIKTKRFIENTGVPPDVYYDIKDSKKTKEQ